MRALPLLIVLVCSLAASATPELTVAAAPDSAGESDYLALQGEADLARDLLAQAYGRRIANLRLAVN